MSKFWTTPRGRYRVTKCCPAGAQMFLRPLHTRIDVRFLHIPASAVAQTASNACGYPNAADGATPIPHIPPGCFLWLRSPMSLSMRAWMLAFINISVLGFRFFKVFAPVRQAPYIADNFGNIAGCPDGGQLSALSAAPGWACGGVSMWGAFVSNRAAKRSAAGRLRRGYIILRTCTTRPITLIGTSLAL